LGAQFQGHDVQPNAVAKSKSDSPRAASSAVETAILYDQSYTGLLPLLRTSINAWPPQSKRRRAFLPAVLREICIADFQFLRQT